MDKKIVSPYDYKQELALNKNDNIFQLPNPLELLEDRSTIILSGQTRAGKTTLLHVILNEFILKSVKPENIVIFSKTAKDLDESYTPLIRHLAKNTEGTIKIFEDIEMGILDSIVNRQKKKKVTEIYESIYQKRDMTPLDKWIIIFDDILGDKELKSFQSDLANYTTRSRHSNILNIFLTQDYNAIPTKIRRNSNLVFLLAMDTYPDTMIEENAPMKKNKEFQEAYETNVNYKKNRSFIIIDRGAPIETRFILCDGGQTCQYLVF